MEFPHSLDAVGLMLDMLGFLIIFVVAMPALMRKNFVPADRVGLDGVRPDRDAVLAIGDAEGRQRRARRRRRWETAWFVGGGSLVLVGFGLQAVAAFVA